MKIIKRILLINLIFFISLLIFSINNKVFAEEKIDEIADFNYIPKREYLFVENDNGHFNIDANGNKYFHYNMLQGEDTIEIIYKDGTKHIYKYDGGYDDEDWGDFFDSEGNGIECPVRITVDQFYNNKWKLGKNNYLTVRFLGVEYKTQIELVEDEHRNETETTKNGSIIDKCCFCGNIRTCFPKKVKLSKNSFKYNKKVQKPTIIIKDGNGKVVNKSNYTITYSNKNSKKVGEYTVKIKFKGKYKGTKTLTYQIKPKTVSIKKITSGSKKNTVKWNKNTTQTTGYQIQYATDSTFYSNENKDWE